MKNKILLSSVGLLLFNTSFAQAVDFKPFIGVNIAANAVAWSEKVNNLYNDLGVSLPTSFLGGGIDFGIRFKTDNIYNAAIAFAYDYAFDSKATLDSFAKDYVQFIKVGFSAISATFDNYIRLSGDLDRRQDLVLGLGIANATERIEIVPTYYGEINGLKNTRQNDNGTRFVFKIGYNDNISEHVDWYINGRVFVPTASEDDTDALFNLSTGLRYVF